MNRIIVSACLMGETVRYDGNRLAVLPPLPGEWGRRGRVVSFCAEVAGGLPVPRPPAELTGCSGEDVLAGAGRVVNVERDDVTDAFLAGARAALDATRRHGVVAALLKDGSPSCGCRRIYDGSFAGVRRPGRGVTAALLAEHGVAVFSEEEVNELIAFLKDGADRR